MTWLKLCFFLLITQCISTAEQEVSPVDLSSSASRLEIPQTHGFLWLPMVWNFAIEKTASKELGEPLENLELRKVSIVLVNTKNGKEFIVKLKADSAENSISLDSAHTQKLTFSPIALKLTSGTYELQKLRVVYVDTDKHSMRELEWLIPNPLSSDPQKSLRFVIERGKISAIGRLAFETSFGMKDKNLLSRTVAEAIDKEVTPIDSVLQHLNGVLADQSKVMAGSPDLTRTRVTLHPYQKQRGLAETLQARMGVSLQVPCNANGQFRFIWRRRGETREYVTVFPFHSSAGERCSKEKVITQPFLLPYDEWTLVATHVSLNKTFVLPVQLPFLKKNYEKIATFFKLSGFETSLTAIPEERFVERKLVFPLNRFQNPALSTAVFYIGKFSYESNGSGKAESFETLYRNDYALNNLQQALQSERVSSAFTGTNIESSRTQAKLKGVLRVSSSEKNSAELNVFTTEVRKYALDKATTCIQENEEVDPLLPFSTTARFEALKGETVLTMQGVEVSQKSTISDMKILSHCFERKMRQFRFSRPVIANLAGQFIFSLE